MSFKNKVIYQIYPKSFYDSNGDGIGDIQGIIQKLDYLNYLGIDMIWLTPFFISPENDNGYDIADYYKINEKYGTMEDFELLIAEAKKRNIGVMLDMVFNHTSTEHSWFKNAINGNLEFKDYYIFKENTGKLPTNWKSKFGGSCWEYIKELDSYYLHLFDKTQADLNWENPTVRENLYDIVNFWINKGVEGFRFDVINLISKPKIYENDFIGDGRRFYTDGPNIHHYLKELNSNTFGKYKNIITVGEMSSTSIDNCYKYSGRDENELSMVFSFHHLKIDYKNQDKWSLKPFDFHELKNLLNSWQIGMQENNGWNALFWCNHDQPRIVSRLGDDKNYWKKSAKMLGTVIHLLRGTPYIYQGEEIGMTNAYFTDISQYRDVESLNHFSILKDRGYSHSEIIKTIQERSRDNSRTPMQWNNDINGGFSSGTPWIEVNKNYCDINVQSQIDDKESIFTHYKKLIALRKKYSVIQDGITIPILEDSNSIYAYKRVNTSEELVVIANFYPKDYELTLDFDDYNYQLILSNCEKSDIKLEKKMYLKPYDTMVFYKKY